MRGPHTVSPRQAVPHPFSLGSPSHTTAKSPMAPKHDGRPRCGMINLTVKCLIRCLVSVNKSTHDINIKKLFESITTAEKSSAANSLADL